MRAIRLVSTLLVVVLSCTAGAADAIPPPQIAPQACGGGGQVLDLSPDGRLVVTVVRNVIRLWDARGGGLVRTLPNATDIDTSTASDGGHLCAFSPDGRELAVGLIDGSACLWEVATGRVLRTLRTQNSHVRTLAFSSDGRTVVTLTARPGEPAPSSAHLWNSATGELRPTMPHHEDAVVGPGCRALLLRVGAAQWRRVDVRSGVAQDSSATAVGNGDLRACSEDGSLAVGVCWTGLETNHARAVGTVLDLRTGKQLRELVDPEGSVRMVAIAPNGKTAATATLSRVMLWDLRTGACLRTLTDAKLDNAVSLAFTADSARVFASGDHSRDGWYCVWDVRSGQCLAAAHGADGGFAFSSDGRNLATSSATGPVVTELASGRKVAAAPRPCLSLSSAVISPDGRSLALAGPLLWVWRPLDGLFTPLAQSQYRGGHAFGGGASSSSVAFSHDGRHVMQSMIVQSMNRSPGPTQAVVQAWDAATGQMLPGVRGRDWAAFSPEGGTFVVGASPYDAVLYDGASGEKRATVRGALPAAFSPDGALVALADLDGITVYDARKGAVRLVVDPPSSRSDWAKPKALAFSPDGRLLSDGSRLWDVAAGGCRELSPHSVDALAFSPDGRFLAVQRGGVIQQFDTRNGAPRGGFEAAGAPAPGLLCFSPDGSRLANGGAARSGWCGAMQTDPVQIRDAGSGRIIHEFGGCTAPVMSPDWRFVVGLTQDGLRFWNVRTGEVLLDMVLAWPEAVAPLAAGQTGQLGQPHQGESRSSPAIVPSWIAYTPDGRCDCSDDAKGLVRWCGVTHLLPLGAEPEGRHVPGLVARVLGERLGGNQARD